MPVMRKIYSNKVKSIFKATEKDRLMGMATYGMESRPEPEIRFCPYCGVRDIRFEKGVPRCGYCRNVFFVNWTRKLRKKPERTS